MYVNGLIKETTKETMNMRDGGKRWIFFFPFSGSGTGMNLTARTLDWIGFNIDLFYVANDVGAGDFLKCDDVR